MNKEILCLIFKSILKFLWIILKTIFSIFTVTLLTIITALYVIIIALFLIACGIICYGLGGIAAIAYTLAIVIAFVQFLYILINYF